MMNFFMTSSKHAGHRPKNLGQLLDAISESQLREKIDAPLNLATSTFPTPDKCPEGQRQLIEVLGTFVQHVYEHGIPWPRKLSDEQARAEAIHLLDAAYQNATGAGFQAALIDLQNPIHNGLAAVLAGLAEIIRQRERQIYMRGMFHQFADPLDWPAQVQLARKALEYLTPHIPPALEHCLPHQLAGEWVSLVLLHRETDRLLGDMVRPKGINPVC